MKLKIWSDKETQTTSEGELFVKLEVCPEHLDIHAVVVDYKGERIDHGHLLTIDQDLKCLIISDHVNDLVPLKTDIDGLLLHMSEQEYRDRRKEHMHNAFMSHMVKSMHDQEQQQASKH